MSVIIFWVSFTYAVITLFPIVFGIAAVLLPAPSTIALAAMGVFLWLICNVLILYKHKELHDWLVSKGKRNDLIKNAKDIYIE